MEKNGGLLGFGRPDCKVMIFMGVTNPDNPKHQRQSQILIPTDVEGIENLRMLNRLWS